MRVTAAIITSKLGQLVQEATKLRQEYKPSDEFLGDMQYFKKQAEVLGKILEEIGLLRTVEAEWSSVEQPDHLKPLVKTFNVWNKNGEKLTVKAERFEAKSSLIFYNGKEVVASFGVGYWVFVEKKHEHEPTAN